MATASSTITTSPPRPTGGTPLPNTHPPAPTSTTSRPTASTSGLNTEESSKFSTANSLHSICAITTRPSAFLCKAPLGSNAPYSTTTRRRSSPLRVRTVTIYTPAGHPLASSSTLLPFASLRATATPRASCTSTSSISTALLTSNRPLAGFGTTSTPLARSTPSTPSRSPTYTAIPSLHSPHLLHSVQ